MFEVDLKSQVPKYGAEKGNWGGPACAQMAMNGYPPGATSCFVTQTDIWNSAQTHNEEGGVGPWGIGWYVDPTGMTTSLQNLCPPQHQWVDVSGPDKKVVLYTLLRWMANYRYASLVCTYNHDSWSALVYYRTSDDPRTVSHPTLEKVGCYLPSMGSGADYKEIDGSLWMTGPFYWGAPCGGTTPPVCGTKWRDKYVGIGEPPDEEGAVHVEEFPRVGKSLIDPAEAVERARAWLAERRRSEHDETERQLHGARARRPMLVRELSPEGGDRRSRRDVRCYAVPFGNRYDSDEHGTGLSRFTVLVNASTGRFEELTVFGRPRRYMSEREALGVAATNLRLSRREVGRFDVELVTYPFGPHVSTAEPAWRVYNQERELFVTQAGLVLGNLNYATFRGG